MSAAADVGNWLRRALSGGTSGASADYTPAAALRDLEAIRAARGWPMMSAEYEAAAAATERGEYDTAATILRATGWPGAEKAAAMVEHYGYRTRKEAERGEDTTRDLGFLFDPRGLPDAPPPAISFALLGAAIIAGAILLKR